VRGLTLRPRLVGDGALSIEDGKGKCGNGVWIETTLDQFCGMCESVNVLFALPKQVIVLFALLKISELLFAL
jgi:hypothetical protein